MQIENSQLRRLLQFITRNEGWVTARAVAKGVAHCRDAGVAQKALQALVDLNVGKWVSRQPGRQGGRPGRVFVLTDAQALERQIQRSDAAAAAATPGRVQRLVQDVMCMSNQYQGVSCQVFAQAFEKASKLMATIRSEGPYPDCRREIRFQKGGRWTVSWILE